MSSGAPSSAGAPRETTALSGWAALTARLGHWLPADLARSGRWRQHATRAAIAKAGRRHLGV